MPCFTCKSDAPALVPKIETPPMRYTKETSVVGVNGKPYALNQALVPVEHYPRGEWDVRLVIAGIPKTLSKPTAS